MKEFVVGPTAKRGFSKAYFERLPGQSLRGLA
jgi:hypothetical protein